MKKIFSLILSLFILVFLLSGCSKSKTATKQSKETIKIGLMGPLTGAYASEGQDMKQITTLLAEELNAKGGVLGKTVEVIVEDDGSDPRNASIAAQKLSTQNIVAVIGTYGSSVTEASQNIYDEAKIIQIATGSTNIRLTEKGLKYFFRTCPRDDSQGQIAFKTLKAKGVSKIAILHDNSSYSKGLADETLALLKQEGIEVVFYDALTPKENDYTAILTKMKSKNPDIVFYTGYFNECGLLLKQSREMNWNIPFLGGDATNNVDLIQIAGKSAEGFECISPILPQDINTTKAAEFMANYKEKYNSFPTSIWAVLSGDAFEVIVEAIKQTSSTEPDKIADYLKHNMKNFESLTGGITFDEKGDRIGDVYKVYKVTEGSFRLL